MQSKIKSILKSHPKPSSSWLPFIVIFLVIVFFSIRLVITYDSAHYLNYVSIFEGHLPPSSWDIVRGPVFPAIIFLFDIVFGKTGTGILIGAFLFYLLFSATCYYTCKEICKSYKHRDLVQNLLLAILILNPLIMGYFHVLLTEFIAITFTMLNIVLAYKWLYIDAHNKNHLLFYSLYFILSVMFCYHLKQSYIIIAFAPLIIATITSVIQKHTRKNVLYRLGTLFIAIFCFIASLFAWDFTLQQMGVNLDTGRDSSTMLSQQLLKAYQITYDQDGDGVNDDLSTLDAIGVLLQDFFSNPVRFSTMYISNYCGLTSICAINTNNGVEYYPSLDFAGIDTFENTAIGYRAYSNSSNIFDMTESLHHNSILYGESSDRSLIAYLMNLFKIPTNLLFKTVTLLCFLTLIFIIIFKLRIKTRRYQNLFILCLMLLSTAFLHLAFTAGLGLIIDRYAIEAFTPAALGIFGTITYCIVLNRRKS